MLVRSICVAIAFIICISRCDGCLDVMYDINATRALIEIKSHLAEIRLEEARQGDQLAEILRILSKPNCNCPETSSPTNRISLIHSPSYGITPFRVLYDENDHGAGWIVILRRQDGSVNFFRNWADYKCGFGDLNGEFFLGLDKIHALTADKPQQLLVLLEDTNGIKSYEKYESFAIGNEQQSYKLHTLGKAEGSAGDSLRLHFGLKFATFDRPNGVDSRNCAILYTGAWWYEKCHYSHLTGKYGDDTSGKGINWYTFRGHVHSLKFAAMMIRPVN